jgi:hypothetical protein
MEPLSITNVSPENAIKECFFCVKNPKAKGFDAKRTWLEQESKNGLQLKILKIGDKQVGFIEYTPIEHAWRPVSGSNFMFIHCLYIYPNAFRSQQFASKLIEACEMEAKEKMMDGVCSFASKGPWITTHKIFAKNGYEKVATQGRFELMVKKFNDDATVPEFIDWTSQMDDYEGWHLLYADQCPWHEKCVEVMANIALDNHIDLKINKLETANDAQHSPSGFGTFSLIKDGRLLEDHYISHTRFKNILKKELA